MATSIPVGDESLTLAASAVRPAFGSMNAGKTVQDIGSWVLSTSDELRVRFGDTDADATNGLIIPAGGTLSQAGVPPETISMFAPGGSASVFLAYFS